jgi:hypothetical protein
MEFLKKRGSMTRAIGFTQGTTKTRAMRICDIIRRKSVGDIMCLLLFGPAHALLPTAAEEFRQSADTQFELRVIVKGEVVKFTTGSTNRHSADANGVNHEAINVCYQQ